MEACHCGFRYSPGPQDKTLSHTFKLGMSPGASVIMLLVTQAGVERFVRILEFPSHTREHKAGTKSGLPLHCPALTLPHGTGQLFRESGSRSNLGRLAASFIHLRKPCWGLPSWRRFL